MSELTLVVDFSSNMISATIEQEQEILDFVSSATPNNFLALLDLMKDANYVINKDFIDEIEYSVAEY